MLFKVDYHIDNIYLLDINFLKENNFKNFVIDLDQTLDSSFSKKPDSKVLNYLNNLIENDIKPIIISNNTKRRVSFYLKGIDVLYLASANKFFSFKIKKFLNKNNIDISSTLFAGDQLFTDSIYTKKIKGKFLLTEPLEKKDNFFTKLIRKIDIIIRKRLFKKNKLGIQLGGK